LLDTISAESHHLARTEIAHEGVTQIEERRRLADYAVSILFLPDDDRRTSPQVAGADDAVLREEYERK
jgi:hypothetical protein